MALVVSSGLLVLKVRNSSIKFKKPIKHRKMTFSSSNIDSEIIFTLSRKEIPQKPSSELNENNDANESNSLQDDTVLCVIWKGNKIGAAYYKMNNQQLYVLQEMVDLPPTYLATQFLCRQVNAFHTITIGSQCNSFVKFLVHFITNVNDDAIGDSLQTAPLPTNMSLFHLKQCTYEACEQKVIDIKLSSEPKNIIKTQREVFLHSIIDFDSKLSVHALGALVTYVEKNWAHLNENRNDELKFVNINQISLSDRVFMDRNAFAGLHIFERHTHEAKFQQGKESTNREGLSIYRLLSQYCKSKLGFFRLRNILLNPVTNIDELNKRLDFIELAIVPTNRSFIESLQENITKISDLNSILRKIKYSRGNNRDWEVLYTTVYHTLFFHELCGPHRLSSELLKHLDSVITPELYDLHHAISTAIDFTTKIKRNRPYIKLGLDAELDAKQFRKKDIIKSVTAAAKFAVNQLPDFVNECSVVHIPEMGHLVAVKEWGPNCNPNELKSYGFEFVFELKGTIHYKNAMCLELNRQLGDIHNDILAHENRIIERLTGYILSYDRYICEPLKVISLLDCLISMSLVAKEKGYVRPRLNQDSIHEIEGGRYPLLELHSTNVVANNYFSGGDQSRIKIITGPNASGKSVYLKQTTLIIFLAHVGSYVPATRANIGIVHSIHCRIHATESAGVSLSAFMLDLSQMSQALHYAKRTSLVILDEFGRGTSGDDGTALLVGALKKFSDQKDGCPHLMVSTHLHKIGHYLPNTNLTSHLKLEHTRTNNNIVFLYKVVEGISDSYAFEVSASAGLDQQLVSRAKEFYEALYKNSYLCLKDGNQESNLSVLNLPDTDD